MIHRSSDTSATGLRNRIYDCHHYRAQSNVASRLIKNNYRIVARGTQRSATGQSVVSSDINSGTTMMTDLSHIRLNDDEGPKATSSQQEGSESPKSIYNSIQATGKTLKLRPYDSITGPSIYVYARLCEHWNFEKNSADFLLSNKEWHYSNPSIRTCEEFIFWVKETYW